MNFSVAILITIVHVLIILTFYVLPFLVSWKIVAIVVFLYYLQIALLNRCVLTILQFKEQDRTTSFYSYLLEKFGFHPDREKVRFIVDRVIPLAVLAVALIYQLVLGKSVLIS